jgi:hypothetical protein
MATTQLTVSQTLLKAYIVTTRPTNRPTAQRLLKRQAKIHQDSNSDTYIIDNTSLLPLLTAAFIRFINHSPPVYHIFQGVKRQRSETYYPLPPSNRR